MPCGWTNRTAAGELLQYAVEDAGRMGYETLYPVTDYTSFYERYGWAFLTMVNGEDGCPAREEKRMYNKCRIACVGLAVVSLIGLAVTLYVPEVPNLTAAWLFAYACIAGLLGNWIVSMVELHHIKKEYRAGKKDETAPENRL